MWIACTPGGRFFRSRAMRTPVSAAVIWAVPTDAPLTSLSSTLTGLCAATYRAVGIPITPANITATNIRVFMSCLRQESMETDDHASRAGRHQPSWHGAGRASILFVREGDGVAGQLAKSSCEFPSPG